MKLPLILQIISVASGTVAVVLGMVAAATYDWYKACDGSGRCIYASLYSYAGSFGRISRSDFLTEIGWGIGHETTVIAGAAFILCSLVFLFVGTCFVAGNLVTTCYGRCSAKSLRVGTVLLTFTVVFLLVGMILISANNRKVNAEQRSPDYPRLARTSTEEPPTTVFHIDESFFNELTNLFGGDMDFGDLGEDGNLDYRKRRALGDDETKYSFGSSYVVAWVGYGMALCSHLNALFAIMLLKTPKDKKITAKPSTKVTTVA